MWLLLHIKGLIHITSYDYLIKQEIVNTEKWSKFLSLQMKQSEKEKAPDSKSQHSTKNHIQAFLTSDFKRLFMQHFIFDKYAQL